MKEIIVELERVFVVAIAITMSMCAIVEKRRISARRDHETRNRRAKVQQ